MKFAILLVSLSLPTWAATTVLFQPSSPTVGPFPSNALTVSSPAQKTGLQINLPLPAGCTAASPDSGCVNVELLNQLDGFSVNPRIQVCFSGPVDVSTLSKGINLITADRFALPIAINQIVFDPASSCAYAKPG